MNTETLHEALTWEDYDRLVALFGEKEHNATRWIEIGAGTVRLVFFAPRVPRVPPVTLVGDDLCTVPA